MEPMVKTVDMKVYRKTYFNFLAIMTIMAAGTFFLVQSGIYINWSSDNSNVITDVLLVTMIGVAVLYSFYLKRLKEKMQSIVDFEEKLSFHRKYFNSRMWWNIASGAVSCFLYLLTAHRFFFWFVLFDFLSLLIVFPNKFFFKKELNDDEIIFL